MDFALLVSSTLSVNHGCADYVEFLARFGQLHQCSSQNDHSLIKVTFKDIREHINFCNTVYNNPDFPVSLPNFSRDPSISNRSPFFLGLSRFPEEAKDQFISLLPSLNVSIRIHRLVNDTLYLVFESEYDAEKVATCFNGLKIWFQKHTNKPPHTISSPISWKSDIPIVESQKSIKTIKTEHEPVQKRSRREPEPFELTEDVGNFFLEPMENPDLINEVYSLLNSRNDDALYQFLLDSNFHLKFFITMLYTRNCLFLFDFSQFIFDRLQGALDLSHGLSYMPSKIQPGNFAFYYQSIIKTLIDLIYLVPPYLDQILEEKIHEICKYLHSFCLKQELVLFTAFAHRFNRNYSEFMKYRLVSPDPSLLVCSTLESSLQFNLESILHLELKSVKECIPIKEDDLNYFLSDLVEVSELEFKKYLPNI
ncbi:hypothetical protein RCL1_000230 [Eukaryota sp. TZLM3-RCL]